MSDDQRSRFTPGDRIIYGGKGRGGSPSKEGQTGTVVRFYSSSHKGGTWVLNWDNPKLPDGNTYSADYMTLIDDSKDFEFDV